MSPQVIFIGGEAPPPVFVDDWINRDQARADLRNTPAVDLDPLNLLNASANRYTSKPSAVQVTNNLNNEKLILMAFRGQLILLGDDGGAGDPIIVKDDWTIAEVAGRYNELVKVDENTAYLFVYGIGGAPFLGLTAYKAFEISISGESFTVGAGVLLGGGGYLGNTVPQSLIGSKSVIEYVGSDAGVPHFLNTQHIGVPSATLYGSQLFTTLEGGAYNTDAQTIGSSATFPVATIYDAINDGFHVIARQNGIAGDYIIGFAERIGLALTYSGDSLNLSTNLNFNEIKSAELNANNEIVVNDERFAVLSYNDVTGYTIVTNPTDLNSSSSVDMAYEFGLFNPPFDGNDIIQPAGYNDQRSLINMGFDNAKENFFNGGFGTSILNSHSVAFDGANITIGTLIDEVPQFTIDELAAPNLSHRLAMRASPFYVRKDNSTIYCFYTYTNAGQAKVKGSIIRK